MQVNVERRGGISFGVGAHEGEEAGRVEGAAGQSGAAGGREGAGASSLTEAGTCMQMQRGGHETGSLFADFEC